MHPASSVLRRRARFLAGSAGALTLGAVVAQAITALAALVLAHASGPRGIGEISIGSAAVALVSDVTDFGTGTYIAREVAARSWAVVDAVTTAFRRSVPCATTCVVWAAGSIVVPGRPHWLSLILACYCYAFFASLSVSAIMRADGAFISVAVANILERLFLCVVVVVAVGVHGNVILAFAGGLAGGKLVSLTTNLAVAARRFGPLSDGRVQARPWSIYRHSASLGLSGLATDIQVLESPLVAFGGGVTGAGIYGAASKITGPLLTPMSAIASVVFNRLARHRDHPERARPDITRSMLAPVAYVIGVIPVEIFAPRIVRVALGPAFGIQTSDTLRVMAVTVIFAAAAQLTYTSLIALGHERRAAGSLWCTIPLGLLLTAAGARAGGPPLAAVGGLAAQATCLIWQAVLLRRLVSPPGARTALEPVV